MPKLAQLKSNILKIGSILVQYLLRNKHLSLHGLGVFSIDNSANPVYDEEKQQYDSPIHFSPDSKAADDSGLEWKHTYGKYPDPEGLLSTLPAIGTALLGVLVGIRLRFGLLGGGLGGPLTDRGERPATGDHRGDRGHDLQTLRMFSASASVRCRHELGSIIRIVQVAIPLPAR